MNNTYVTKAQSGAAIPDYTRFHKTVVSDRNAECAPSSKEQKHEVSTAFKTPHLASRVEMF